jgi:hypothetical protein
MRGVTSKDAGLFCGRLMLMLISQTIPASPTTHPGRLHGAPGQDAAGHERRPGPVLRRVDRAGVTRPSTLMCSAALSNPKPQPTPNRPPTDPQPTPDNLTGPVVPPRQQHGLPRPQARERLHRQPGLCQAGGLWVCKGARGAGADLHVLRHAGVRKGDALVGRFTGGGMVDSGGVPKKQNPKPNRRRAQK